jgi:acetyltransferase-like isoleucine patch superfamily enzyme
VKVGGDPRIEAGRMSVAPDVQFGPGVDIEADELEIGPGSRIGMSGDDDFRTPPGVRIRVRRLAIGAGATIGRAVRIDGGEVVLEDGVRILRQSTIKVVDLLRVGAHGTVNESCEIGGRRISIGQELWMLPTAKIGGGSAYETPSRLDIGHFAHLGVQTLVNTARPVTIGHEVGLGTRTSLYTHGAYPSRLQGFPVSFDGIEIGDFSWIPGATINPGVRIGRNCVVGVNSLVTTSLPDGCLAAGTPAKVIKEDAYPRPFGPDKRAAFFAEFLERYAVIVGTDARVAIDDPPGATRLDDGQAIYAGIPDDEAGRVVERMAAGGLERRRVVVVGNGTEATIVPEAWTILDPAGRHIRGAADGVSERFVNELRRYGIRFYSRPAGDRYLDWEATPPAFGAPTPTAMAR